MIRKKSESYVECVCKEKISEDNLLMHSKKCVAISTTIGPIVEALENMAHQANDSISQTLLLRILKQLEISISGLFPHPAPASDPVTFSDDSIFCKLCNTRFLDFNQCMYLQCLHPFCKECLKKRIFKYFIAKFNKNNRELPEKDIATCPECPTQLIEQEIDVLNALIIANIIDYRK
jgi:hypothetical protein